jgi:hypothetical protein
VSPIGKNQWRITIAISELIAPTAFLGAPLLHVLGKFLIRLGLWLSITYGNPFKVNGLWLNFSAN